METTVSPAPASKKPGFLINRNFALLWGGQSISNVGDFVFSTTLVLWIAAIIARGQTWGPLAVSGVLLATSFPIFLVGPIAGVYVDRWDKRRTMMAMDASRAILIALLLVVAIGKPPVSWQLGLIYTVVFLASACAQFFNPARFALIGDIVEEPYRARASGLSQTTFSVAVIIGPPLAAPLLFAFGVEWALILNALSFVVSFLAILAMRVPSSSGASSPAPHGNFFQDFSAGLRFFFSNRILLTLFITIIIVMLGGGALNALDIFFTTQNLHTSADLYGFLGAAQGFGMVLGAILASIFAQRIGVARLFWLSIVALGTVLLVFARLTSFAPALAVLFVGGLTLAPIDVAAGPLILHATPKEFVGRVMAVISPTNALASIVSAAIAGSLASTVLHGFHAVVLGISLGPIDTIFTGTAILVTLGGFYAMVGLRGVTLAKAEDAPAPEARAEEAEPAAAPERAAGQPSSEL
jgi:MFS family permease